MWSIEIPFKKTSVDVSFTQEWQSGILWQIQGMEGSKERQELTAEDQNYPDNRVEVLAGHVVPFSGADPGHSPSSLMPWVMVTATASASNPIWAQGQVTKQNGKKWRKGIFQGIAQQETIPDI